MSKESTQIAFPPVWCSRICTNSMSEVCVTKCAVKRDCSEFKLKDISLVEMPDLPYPQELQTAYERYTAIYVYLNKVIDHLKGKENEPNYPRIRSIRRDTNRTDASRLLEDKSSEGLPLGEGEENTTFQDREKRETSETRRSEVAGSED